MKSFPSNREEEEENAVPDSQVGPAVAASVAAEEQRDLLAEQLLVEHQAKSRPPLTTSSLQ